MIKIESSPRRILLAISGSIAAYKAADIVSLLKKEGHEVQCLLTQGAAQFVSPLTLETLSQLPVQQNLFGPEISGTEHIRLARWADLMVFAPATAHLIAKLSLGLADDLVTTVALATEAPWFIAPAMNTVMWNQSVTQSHCQVLEQRGARFVEPASGILACGEDGVGKLASPEQIVQDILGHYSGRFQDFQGQHILITSGPTITRIDSVRYITNGSTGKMGAAIAEEALRRGATVDYITGIDKGVVLPRASGSERDRLVIQEVTSAEEMAQKALQRLPKATGVVAAAAVMDYEVASPISGKSKRAMEPVHLELRPSTDVLATLRERAEADTWFLGFAAETDRMEENARDKMKKKRLDFLFANEVSRDGRIKDTGFGSTTNGGLFFHSASEAAEPLSVQSKSQIARLILNRIASAKMSRGRE